MKARLVIVSTLGLLSACQQHPPSGQVIARVNGDEITLRDLKVEGSVYQADVRPTQQALLDGIINRTLLVNEAKRAALDATPDYLSYLRRDRQLLLVDALRRQTEDNYKPSPGDVAQFIQRQPQRFAARRIFVVDRISAAGGASVKAIQDARSSASIVTRLTSLGFAPTRNTVVLDSAQLSETQITDLSATSPNKPWIRMDGDTLLSDVMLSSTSVPMSLDQMTREANADLIAAAREEKLARLLDQLREEARIDRNPGLPK